MEKAWESVSHSSIAHFKLASESMPSVGSGSGASSLGGLNPVGAWNLPLVGITPGYGGDDGPVALLPEEGEEVGAEGWRLSLRFRGRSLDAKLTTRPSNKIK